MASTGYDPTTILGAALQSLDALEADTDHAHILGASLNQELDAAGAMADTVEVYWGLFGRPGVFTTRVPWDQNWLAIAFDYIGLKAALVQAIYDGLPSKDAIPAGPTGGTIPGPGGTIPQPGVAVPV